MIKAERLALPGMLLAILTATIFLLVLANLVPGKPKPSEDVESFPIRFCNPDF